MPITLSTTDFGHDLWIDGLSQNSPFQLFPMDRIYITKVIIKVIDKTTTGFEADWCLIGWLLCGMDRWLVDWLDMGLAWLHHSNAEGKVMVIVYGFDWQCKIPWYIMIVWLIHYILRYSREENILKIWHKAGRLPTLAPNPLTAYISESYPPYSHLLCLRHHYGYVVMPTIPLLLYTFLHFVS